MGENQIQFDIRSRILNDKLPVNYQWLQKSFDISPRETESYMKQYLSQNDNAKADYLKCSMDKTEVSVLISIIPTINYQSNLSQYELGLSSSTNKNSRSIICNEAQCLPRVVKQAPITINNPKPQVNKIIPTKSSTSGKIDFPSQPKSNTSAPKVNKSNDIKASLKLFDSLISEQRSKTNQDKLDKPVKETEINVESVKLEQEVTMAAENISSASTNGNILMSIKDEKDENEMIKDSTRKRHNLFENYEDDSAPQKTNNKRRRLIIESDDETSDDNVLVNDSIIEDRNHDVLSPKKRRRKSIEEQTSGEKKKNTKEDNKKMAKEVRKNAKEDDKKFGNGDNKKVAKEDKKKIATEDTKKMANGVTNKIAKGDNKNVTKEDNKKIATEDTKKMANGVTNKIAKGDNKNVTKEDNKKTTKEILVKSAFGKSNKHEEIDSLEINEGQMMKVKENAKNAPIVLGTRKRKIMKQVERTFKDEDGFLVTQKVMEAFSDNEDVENDVKNTSTAQLKAPNKMVKKSPKVALLDPKKSKQTSLTSFFQKKT